MKNRPNKHRVITFLSREELEFLDRLQKDMMFSTGAHVSRSQILEDLAELLVRTSMSAIGIKDNEALEKRMMEALAKVYQQNNAKDRHPNI